MIPGWNVAQSTSCVVLIFQFFIIGLCLLQMTSVQSQTLLLWFSSCSHGSMLDTIQGEGSIKASFLRVKLSARHGERCCRPERTQTTNCVRAKRRNHNLKQNSALMFICPCHSCRHLGGFAVAESIICSVRLMRRFKAMGRG